MHSKKIYEDTKVWVSALAFAAVADLTSLPTAQADEAQAKDQLKAMSDYLGAQKSISFVYDTNLMIVTTGLQKLAFAISGAITLEWPGKLHVTRNGGFVAMEPVFDGKTLVALGKNIFVTDEAVGSIDDLFDTLRDTYGVHAPGTDLLSANVYDQLIRNFTDVKDLDTILERILLSS